MAIGKYKERGGGEKVVEIPRFIEEAIAICKKLGAEYKTQIVAEMSPDEATKLGDTEKKFGLNVLDAYSESLELMLPILADPRFANWFGQGLRLNLAHRFDDVFNKIDIVCTLPEGVSGVALDATMSQQGSVRKIQTIEKEVSEGKLGKLRFPEIQTNVPRVVIGLQHSTIVDLCQLFTKAYKGDAQAKLNLRTHWAQKRILEQIDAQFNAYKAIAESRGQIATAEILETYRSVADTYLRGEKSYVRNAVIDKGQTDLIHQAIITETRLMAARAEHYKKIVQKAA